MSKAPRPAVEPTSQMIQAGILAWILPGLGHWYLGHRGLALVFFFAITLPYLTGVAIGGIKNSINPYANRWLFLAEMGAGGYTTAFFIMNQRMTDIPAHALADAARLNRFPDELVRKNISFYPENDVSQIYLAVAGLLNVLAVFDVLSRSLTGGRPVFYHELKPRPDDGVAP